MNVVVCIKVVKAVLVFPDKQYSGDYVVNPYDLYTIKDLLQFKKRSASEVKITCLCMGPLEVKAELIKCCAMGCDDVILLCDREFGGSDTIATTYILSKAMEKIGIIDLIVCGKQAVDGETGQVVWGLAKRLGIACVTNVTEILALNSRRLRLVCQADGYKNQIEVGLPVLISYRDFMLNYHNLSLVRLKQAKQKEITVWDGTAIGVDKARCGMSGSKTKVVGTILADVQKEAIYVQGSIAEKTRIIKELLLSKQFGR